MKTELILVGKTNDKHFQAGIDDYCQRIGHYMPFSITVIPELKNTKSLSFQQQKNGKEAHQWHSPRHFWMNWFKEIPLRMWWGSM